MSIKNKDKNIIISEIKVKKPGFQGIFLLLEGSSDISVFRNYINKNSCKLIDCDGKDNIEPVIQEISQEVNLLAIKDSDFKNLLKVSNDFNNIIFTDYHDLEIMIYSTASLMKVIGAYGSEQKINSFLLLNSNLFYYILKKLYPLSIFRYLSYTHNYQISFKDIEYSEFVNKDDLTIDISTMVLYILNREKNKNKLKLSNEISASINKLLNDNYDLLQISNGHDFTNLLIISLKKILGSYSSKELLIKEFERAVMVSYEKNSFVETDLYKSLKDWENNSGIAFMSC